MIRVLTVEREYGSGGEDPARQGIVDGRGLGRGGASRPSLGAGRAAKRRLASRNCIKTPFASIT